MKLKTLKEIHGNLELSENLEDYDIHISMKKLRKEAVKWIKYLTVNGNGSSMINGQIHTFEHFFNITEKDLK